MAAQVVYPAHIRVNPETNEKIIQPCEDHCRKTAAYAAAHLKDAGLENVGRLVGLLHDGKYTMAFKNYIEASVNGEKTTRGSVIHTFAGAWYFLTEYHHDGCPELSDLTAELLAWVIGSHHGQFDIIDSRSKNGFLHRMETDASGSRESIENLFNICISKDEVDDLFGKAVEEIERITDRINDLIVDNDPTCDEEFDFHLGLAARLILSALMDGDRRDTAKFMDGTVFPAFPDNMKNIWADRLAYMEDKLSSLPKDTPINQARHRISDQCRDCAEKGEGVFRLNVPTGAGKTLSALRFALAHAAKFGKRRIVFTAPLLSIIDQNSEIIREYIGDDSLILEHHSDVVNPDASSASEDKLLRERYERLVETYDVPVIITTMVQLLNCVFDGKKTSIRRFHALCNSVIVIDEVQTLPVRLLSMFNAAVNFLSAICHTTVVLCSATQPCLEEADHPLRVLPRDIVPFDGDLWKPFKRTEIVDAGGMTLEGIGAFSESVLEETDSLLVVCNKKDEAEKLFEMINIGKKYHLSASMCMEHRRQVLDSIRKDQDSLRALQKAGAIPTNEQKIVCVSTQVIEAGVDISFGRVIRFTAGLENAVQAFGRENRNGEYPGTVSAYMVTCTDENLTHLADIQRARTATVGLLAEYKNRPQDFDNDLASDKAVSCYYRMLYKGTDDGFQDDSVRDDNGSTVTLFSLLSTNRHYADQCPAQNIFCMKQAFASAGRYFKVFDDSTTTVIVPYGKGKQLYTDFFSGKAESDTGFISGLLKEAKGYTVSVYDYQMEILEKEKAIVRALDGTVTLLKPGYYDENTGLSIKKIKEGRKVCDAQIM